MTIDAAAAYLNAQVPEYNAGGAPGSWNGGWTPDRIRKVLIRGRLFRGRLVPAIGEPENDALVQNVTDESVAVYKAILRAPFDGTLAG
jgi:hypothetical protein